MSLEPSSQPSNADPATRLVITGVFDGTIGTTSNNFPKVIEVYANDYIPDLSEYGVRTDNGEGTTGTPDYTFPAQPLAAGEFFIVARGTDGAPEFSDYFPNYSADETTSANTAELFPINGVQAILLYYDPNSWSLVDIYGAVSETPPVDSTPDASWNYRDGWAYRKDGEGPSATFDLTEWNTSGSDAVDGCTDNDTCTSQFPIESYTV